MLIHVQMIIFDMFWLGEFSIRAMEQIGTLYHVVKLFWIVVLRKGYQFEELVKSKFKTSQKWSCCQLIQRLARALWRWVPLLLRSLVLSVDFVPLSARFAERFGAKRNQSCVECHFLREEWSFCMFYLFHYF